MTRTVLTGPPARRGLTWGVAVLLGAAVLLGVRDGTDVVAQEKAALPADLALVPADAFAFVSIRVADLWKDDGTKALRAQLAAQDPEMFKNLQKIVSVPPAEIERLTFVITKTPGPGDDGPVVAILVATNKPFDKKKVLDDLVPEAKEEKRKGKTYHVLGDAALYPINASAFVMGRTETVDEVMDQAGKKADGPLAAALAAAAGKHHVTGGIRPVALMATIGNMIPPQVEAFKPLLEVQAAHATLDFAKDAKAVARLVCGSEGEAKEAVTAAKALIALVQTLGLPELEKELDKQPKGKVDNVKALFKEFGAALKTLPIEAKGKDVTAALALKADLPTIARGVAEGLARAGAAGSASSANNLKQMALAMHNYSDANGHFPAAAITDKDGKALLSWRVAILPYIDQDALYKEFRQNEPWDSEYNKKLLTKMPPVYLVPDPTGKEPKEPPTTTHYRVFLGKGAAFEGTSGRRLADFTDGTSNTILIVEAADAVPWTKPDELAFDATKDPPKLGLKDAERFNAAFADGAVRALKKTIDKDTLKAIITRNGGEVVKLPED